MASIRYCFRPSARGEEYEGKIYLRIIYQRRVGTVTTSFRLFPHEWNPILHAPMPEKGDKARRMYLEELGFYLSRERERLEKVAASLKEEGSFSIASILNISRQGTKQSGKGLRSFTGSLADEIALSGHERTAESYRSALRKLLGYVKAEDLSFAEVTPSLIKGFEEYLKGENKALNTISFYMRNLRAVFNKAIKRGFACPPPESPFGNVYTGVQVSRKKAISKGDMFRLNHLLETPEVTLKKEQRQALAIFMFSFHSRGMSFVDLAHLRKEDLRDGTLSYIRRKTGQPMEIRVNKELQRLIGYFGKETDGSPYLLPVLRDESRQVRTQYGTALRRQNRRLKKLAAFAGIEKNLSTHVARHSWATIAKGENIPLRVISECLGHTSENTTRIYLASFERSVLDKANDKVIRAVKKVV